MSNTDINYVVRDREMPDVPSSQAWKVQKSALREWGTYVQSVLTGLSTATKGFATKAAVDASLAHSEGTLALVTQDTTAANNGLYRKVGASGAGSWASLLPYVPGQQMVPLVDAGAGTANALVTTSGVAIPSSPYQALVLLSPNRANTDAATLANNSGTAYPIQFANGSAIVAGTLQPGQLEVLAFTGTAYRLISRVPPSVVSFTAGGTGNAITATIPTAYSLASGQTIFIGTVTAANTGGVTVQFNGGDTFPLQTNSGSALQSGYLTVGMLIAFMRSGNTYRLLSDVASSSIVAAATAQADAAAASAATASTYVSAILGNVATLAALRSRTPVSGEIGKLIFVNEHTTGAGAATGGFFQVVSGSLPTDDDGRNIVSATSPYWYRRVPGQADNALMWNIRSGNTAANNKAQFAKWLGSIPSAGGALEFSESALVPFSNDVPISKPCILLGTVAGAGVSFPSLTANAKGFSITAGPVRFLDLIFQGNGNNANYQTGAQIVSCTGASSASRVVGLTFERCVMRDAGQYAIYAKWTDYLVARACRISNVAYAGLLMESCNDFLIEDNVVDMIGAVGYLTNAYGFAASVDGPGWGANPTLNPLCARGVIRNNTVYGPQIWEAVDCHGANDCLVEDNRLYGAKTGIHWSTVGEATGDKAGTRNGVFRNLISATLPDGSTPSGLTPGNGIQLRGAADGPHKMVHCVGNTIVGYGAAGDIEVGSIRCSTNLENAIISGNIFVDWAGTAIEMSTGSKNISILGNTFGECKFASGSDSSRYCVSIGTNTGAGILIQGNNCTAETNKAQYLAYIPSGYANRVVLDGNRASGVGAVTNATLDKILGSDVPQGISVSGNSAPDPISLAAFQGYTGSPIIIQCSGLTAGVTIGTISNVPIGAMVVIANENDSAQNVTVSATAKSLPGGTAIVLGPKDNLVLMALSNVSNPLRLMARSDN